VDFGQDEKIKRAISKYAADLVRLAFTYVKNIADAEDAVQDVFLTYMLKRPKFENSKHEKAWLMRVTVNKCRDVLKSGWRRKRAAMPDDLAAVPGEGSEILKAVLELEDRYRLPVYLHYFDGLPIEQIARVMNANPSTTGTWLSRGRKALRERLGEDFL